MSAGHAFQRVLEIGEGLDLVELGGSDEGADGCPSGAAMSRVRRLPMPDIAFRSACFDTSSACFAE